MTRRDTTRDSSHLVRLQVDEYYTSKLCSHCYNVLAELKNVHDFRVSMVLVTMVF